MFHTTLPPVEAEQRMVVAHCQPAAPIRQGDWQVLGVGSVLPDIIRALVEASGLPHAEVARRVGLRADTFSQYVSRHPSRRLMAPNMRRLAQIVEACGGRLILEFPHAALGGR